MKVAVKILPRQEVLDSQGRAVAKTLEHLDQKVVECKVGKYILLELETNDPKLASEQAEKMAREVLHNPLIETFELEVL